MAEVQIRNVAQRSRYEAVIDSELVWLIHRSPEYADLLVSADRPGGRR